MSGQQTKLQKIGNSKGIVIPAAILGQLDVRESFELVLEDGRIILIPDGRKRARKGWLEAFRADPPDTGEEVFGDDIGNDFDDGEWTW